MALNYSTVVSSMANMLPSSPTDAGFVAMLPNAIDDAEQRIYRELDLLNTVVLDATGLLTPNSRSFTLPTSKGRFVVTQNVNVVVSGVRTPLLITDKSYIDFVYGSDTASTSPSIPQYYAMTDDQDILVGPPPDQAYGMEVWGTIRPNPLSATNTTTYLTLYLPDLFLTEMLVFAYGYMKDYGAAVDDPQAAPNWENHYKTLWQSANTEEQRKRYASQGWTSNQPAPLATPPRT